MTDVEQKSGLLQRAKEGLQYHLSDATAMLVESTPISAAFEVGVAGMSDDVSLNARLIAAGTTYGGIGWIYGKCRDLWRKTFNVTDKARERIQQFHDFAYTGAFNLALLPILYFTAGSRDIKEMAVGTGVGALVGATNGLFMGPAVDLYRDLTGLQQSERVPRIIREQSPATKKTLATLLAGASVGLTAAVYKTFS